MPGRHNPGPAPRRVAGARYDPGFSSDLPAETPAPAASPTASLDGRVCSACAKDLATRMLLRLGAFRAKKKLQSTQADCAYQALR